MRSGCIMKELGMMCDGKMNKIVRGRASSQRMRERICILFVCETCVAQHTNLQNQWDLHNP